MCNVHIWTIYYLKLSVSEQIVDIALAVTGEQARQREKAENMQRLLSGMSSACGEKLLRDSEM